MDDTYKARKELQKQERQERLKQATDRLGDDPRWTRHTVYYWSTRVCGDRLDYWPSTRKWKYLNRNQHGSLDALARFIEDKEGTR